ncbi:MULTISPECIES: hypothetical protein [Streptomyces]|uniref:hypothetical protein n=1 Tax=Streptomyces TaxID=1883 RepID=UPI000A3A33A9|nr:hypothetical protein [Streptomyces viridochromogenes]
MNDTTPSPTPRTRRTRLIGAAVAALVLIGGGAVAYALLDGEDTPGCAALASDPALRRSLGDAYREGMDCGALGAAIRDAATGPEPGRHTLAEARALHTALTTVAEDIERRRNPGIAPDLRAPLAAALTDYAADTYEVLTGVNGEYTHREDDGPWRDAGTVRTPARVNDLVTVVRAVSEDPAAYADLRAAHVRQCAARLAEVPARTTGARYTGPARGCAAGLGRFDAVAADIPESWAGQWRTDVLRHLADTAGSTPPYATDPAGHLASRWRHLAADRTDTDAPRFLGDDSTRLIDLWTTARHEPSDAAPVKELKAEAAADAGTGAAETRKALACTRRPAECG